MAYTGVATDNPVLQSLQVGSGTTSTTLTAIGRISQSLTPVSVAATTCAEQTFTVPGLLVGDFVDITPPGITAGVAPTCARVSAANTLAITFINPTAGALVPAAGVYQIQLNR
jgi:hypothetical protein